jgi:hypothetical protein
VCRNVRKSSQFDVRHVPFVIGKTATKERVPVEHPFTFLEMFHGVSMCYCPVFLV